MTDSVPVQCVRVSRVVRETVSRQRVTGDTRGPLAVKKSGPRREAGRISEECNKGMMPLQRYAPVIETRPWALRRDPAAGVRRSVATRQSARFETRFRYSIL
jgi:hypothetical protein